MKIALLVYNANWRGGTEVVVHNLLHGLVQSGIDAYVISCAKYEVKNDKVLSLPIDVYNRWERLNACFVNKLMGGALSDYYLGRCVENIVKVNGFDCIVNNTWELVGALLQVHSAKTANVFHWSIKSYERGLLKFHEQSGKVVRFVRGVLYGLMCQRRHRALSKLDALVTLTKAGQEEVIALNRDIKKSRLHQISNPLTYDRPQKILTSLENHRVSFMGRFYEEKGVIPLLRIWRLVVERMPGYRLDIYGEGPLEREMRNYVSLKAIPNVVFHGFVADLEDAYLHSDLLLSTSRTESFGMVFAEAMHFGVPCVSFDCPISPREVLGEAGVLVPCFDEAAYADTVVGLLQDRSRMKALQRKATKRAQDFYMHTVCENWGMMFRR